jgi:hypothetical protein
LVGGVADYPPFQESAELPQNFSPLLSPHYLRNGGNLGWKKVGRGVMLRQIYSLFLYYTFAEIGSAR